MKTVELQAPPRAPDMASAATEDFKAALRNALKNHWYDLR